MGYLGNTPTTQSFISGTDYFNGDGSTTAFTLTRTVASVNDIEAVVNNVVQQPNSAYTLSGTTITFTSAPSAGTNNIYVRYLSTTTQSITPSQNTVSYSTMNTDMQGLFGQSFTNRIINGAMMIDQRNAGASVSTSGSFPVDRFAIGSTGSVTFTAQRSTTAPAGFINSVLWTTGTGAAPTSTQQSNISQGVEGLNVSDFGWGTANAVTVTLSFWVRSSLTGTFCVSITNNSRSYPATYTISAANTWEQKTITIPGDTSGTWVTTNDRAFRVVFDYGTGSNRVGTANTWQSGEYISVSGATQVCATSGATFYLTGVQLEKGSTATSFDYRPYGTELALCQRYCYVIKPSSGEASFANGSNYSTSQINYSLPVPVPMRTTPAATVGSSWINTYQGASGQTSSSSPSVGEYGVGSYRIFLGGLTGLTAGYSSWAIVTSGSSFVLSAEL